MIRDGKKETQSGRGTAVVHTMSLMDRADDARPQSMLAALEAIREDYGSVENYVLTECELEPQAIEQLCRNFIIDDKSTR